MPSNSTSKLMIAAADALRSGVGAIDFSEHVSWVYNPLDYAWESHQQYLRKYARGTRRVLFLGMNPGPWGMTQTGVPFGEIEAVRNWLRIDAPIAKPAKEHPKRLIVVVTRPADTHALVDSVVRYPVPVVDHENSQWALPVADNANQHVLCLGVDAVVDQIRDRLGQCVAERGKGL